MANYAVPLPRDTGNEPMQAYPAPVISKATYNKDNLPASSVLFLTPNTTSVEIATFGGQGAVIRWVPTTETAASAGAKASVISSGLTANFDHYIPAGTMRRFVVPRETGGTYTGGSQAGSIYGLYQRIALINAGATASSILANEY